MFLRLFSFFFLFFNSLGEAANGEINMDMIQRFSVTAGRYSLFVFASMTNI